MDMNSAGTYSHGAEEDGVAHDGPKLEDGEEEGDQGEEHTQSSWYVSPSPRISSVVRT